MDNKIHLTCPNCLATNALLASRLDDNPKCGKCGSILFIGKPVDLDDSNFTKFVSSTKIPVVVDFWAIWCGPCKMMAPVFIQAAHRLEPNIRFAKVNTEIARSVSAQFGIRSIPTIAILKDGVQVTQRPGAVGLEELVSWISHYT